MIRKTLLHAVLIVILALAMLFHCRAQDSTRITMQNAEKQFLEKNLRLIAEKYNIDIARAGIIQAGLYNNPSIQLSSALYNGEQNKILDVSNATGQYAIGLQQLILMAGK